MTNQRSGTLVALLLMLAGVIAGCGTTDRGRTLNVFAAASLTDISSALADSFAIQNPRYRVVLSTAATSVLARQIENGAPADVLLSANPAWVERLDSLDLLARVAELPVSNSLALYQRTDESRSGRIAVGDPDHVPIGIYARSFLECSGSWVDLSDDIVPASDARAALTMLRTGAVPSAILYRSDAAALGDGYRAERFQGGCAPDVRYVGAALKGSRFQDVSAAFLDFVAGPEQHATWQAFGFVLRTDSTTAKDA